MRETTQVVRISIESQDDLQFYNADRKGSLKSIAAVLSRKHETD